jgi:hypothetical protein
MHRAAHLVVGLMRQDKHEIGGHTLLCHRRHRGGIPHKQKWGVRVAPHSPREEIIFERST